MTFDGNPWKPVPTNDPAGASPPGVRQVVAFIALTTGGLVVAVTGLLGALAGPGMGVVLPAAGRAALAGLAGAATAAMLATAVLRLLDPKASWSTGIAMAGAFSVVPCAVVVLVLVSREDGLTTTQFTLLAAAIGAVIALGAVCLSYPSYAAMRPPTDQVIQTSTPAAGRTAIVVLSLAVIGLAASPATLTEPERAAIEADADAGIARLALLTEDDLGPDWTPAGSWRLNPLDITSHLCGSVEGLPNRVAAYEANLVLDLTPENTERGNVDHTVLVSPTIADAEREFAAVDAPGYQACTEAAVARDTAPYAPDATGPPIVTFRRQTFPGLEHGVVDRLVATYPTPDGTNVIHVDFVRMQQGRAIVRLPVMTHNHVMSDADLSVIINAASARLAVAAERLGDR